MYKTFSNQDKLGGLLNELAKIEAGSEGGLLLAYIVRLPAYVSLLPCIVVYA